MSRAFKRFYKQAAIAAVGDGEVGAGQAGFSITLDGKPIRSPGKASLVLSSQALAQAVAAEWSAQGDHVQPDSMPIMTLCCTAIDLVASRRGEVVAEVAAYGESDLLCYRAEKPPELVARQQKLWQPLLDWAAQAHNAPLKVTDGLRATPQSKAALNSLTRAVDAHDDLELTALSSVVRASGSLIIGLALSDSTLSSAQAFDAAELDESFQIEIWGEDPLAAERRASILADIEAAARFLALVRH